MSRHLRSIASISARLDSERELALSRIKRLEKRHELKIEHIANDVQLVAKRAKQLGELNLKLSAQIPRLHKQASSLKKDLLRHKSVEKNLNEQLIKLKDVEKRHSKAKSSLEAAQKIHKKITGKKTSLKSEIDAMKLENILKLKKDLMSSRKKKKKYEKMIFNVRDRLRKSSYVETKHRLMGLELQNLKHKKKRKALLVQEYKIFLRNITGLNAQRKSLKQKVESLISSKSKLNEERSGVVKRIGMLARHYKKLKPLKHKLKTVDLEKQKLDLKRKELEIKLDRMKTIDKQMITVRKELVILAKETKIKKENKGKLEKFNSDIVKMNDGLEDLSSSLILLESKREKRVRLLARLDSLKHSELKQNVLVKTLSDDLSYVLRNLNNKRKLRRQLTEANKKHEKQTKMLRSATVNHDMIKRMHDKKDLKRKQVRREHLIVVREAKKYGALAAKEKKLLGHKKSARELRLALSKLLREKKEQKDKIVSALKRAYSQEVKLKRFL